MGDPRPLIELLLELTALLSFWLLLNTWQRDATSPGRRVFMGLCACVVAWSAGSLGWLVESPHAWAADRVRTLAMFALPPLWLVLALRVQESRGFAGGAVRPAAALLAPVGLVLALPEFAIPGRPEAVTALAPAIRPALVAYAWCTSAVASAFFLRSATRLASRPRRARRVSVALASGTPLLASIGAATLGLGALDPTPIVCAAVLVGVRSELFRGDWIRAVPLSQHDILGRLPTPVVLTDLFGRVLEINAAAQRSLGAARAEAIDRNLEALLHEAPDAPSFGAWALVAEGREIGRIHVPQDAASRSASGVSA